MTFWAAELPAVVTVFDWHITTSRQSDCCFRGGEHGSQQAEFSVLILANSLSRKRLWSRIQTKFGYLTVLISLSWSFTFPSNPPEKHVNRLKRWLGGFQHHNLILVQLQHSLNNSFTGFMQYGTSTVKSGSGNLPASSVYSFYHNKTSNTDTSYHRYKLYIKKEETKKTVI